MVVWSRHLLERIESESIWLFRPDLADVLVGREPLEGLEALGEVIGGHEVREMGAKLGMGFVVEALDGRVLDGSVHPLDLSIGPRVLGFGQAMVDVVAGARYFEGGSPEWLAARKHAFDIGDRPTLALGIGEVDPIVGQHGVDLVGNGFDEVKQEVSRDPPCGLLVQLGEGELRGPIDGDEEVEPALRGAYFGDVDVEVANRIGLELTPHALAVLDIREPGDAVPLQAAVQR